jgi:hypothetical protein
VQQVTHGTLAIRTKALGSLIRDFRSIVEGVSFEKVAQTRDVPSQPAWSPCKTIIASVEPSKHFHSRSRTRFN